jgi:hypothetical protein
MLVSTLLILGSIQVLSDEYSNDLEKLNQCEKLLNEIDFKLSEGLSFDQLVKYKNTLEAFWQDMDKMKLETLDEINKSWDTKNFEDDFVKYSERILRNHVELNSMISWFNHLINEKKSFNEDDFIHLDQSDKDIITVYPLEGFAEKGPDGLFCNPYAWNEPSDSGTGYAGSGAYTYFGSDTWGRSGLGASFIWHQDKVVDITFIGGYKGSILAGTTLWGTAWAHAILKGVIVQYYPEYEIITSTIQNFPSSTSGYIVNQQFNVELFPNYGFQEGGMYSISAEMLAESYAILGASGQADFALENGGLTSNCQWYIDYFHLEL